MMRESGPATTMTASEAKRPAPTGSDTRTPREHWLRIRPWLLSVMCLLAAFAVTVAIGSSAARSSGKLLSPNSAGPNGAKALVETLRDHGVTVTEVDALAAVTESIDRNRHQTVVVHDDAGILDSQRVSQLLAAGADRIVFINPVGVRFSPLNEFAYFGGSITAEGDSTRYSAGESCPLSTNAPELGQGYASGFRAAAEADVPVSECYATQAGALVVFADTDQTEVVLVGAYEQFTNARIASAANAAAAINILGAHEELLWYVPGEPDMPIDTAPKYNDYLPGWITPIALLLLCSAIAAMWWRGVRFGPLVAERLPVSVPANETAEGRARSYATHGARLHALDAIRLGTLTRVAALLGLNRSDSADAIITATAVAARVPRAHAQRVLMDAKPETDAALVDLANAAAELESRVRDSVGGVTASASARGEHRIERSETATFAVVPHAPTAQPNAPNPSAGHSPTTSASSARPQQENHDE